MNISNKKKEPPNINGLTSASLRLRKLCAVANNNTFATIDLFPLWAVSFLYMGDNGSPHPTITCSSSESLTRIPCIAIDSQKLIRLLARFLCLYILHSIFQVRVKFSKLSFLIMFASNFSCIYYDFVYRPPSNTVLKLHFYS